jgi:hypothetical protein
MRYSLFVDLPFEFMPPKMYNYFDDLPLHILWLDNAGKPVFGITIHLSDEIL